MQAELVAIHLGCQKALALGRFQFIIIVCDSQPALQSLQRSQGIGALAHRAREALCTLQSTGIDLQLWWTPAHSDVAENEHADTAAKLATQGNSTDGLVSDILPATQLCGPAYAISIALKLIGNGPPPSGVVPSTSSCRLTWAPPVGQRASHGCSLLLWLSS